MAKKPRKPKQRRAEQQGANGKGSLSRSVLAGAESTGGAESTTRKPKEKPKGRTEQGRFQKGEYQGGPGGPRPGSGRKPLEITELHKQLFSPEVAAKAVRTILHLAETGDLDAAKYICDRVWGKPKQAVEATGLDGEPMRVVIEYQAAPAAR